MPSRERIRQHDAPLLASLLHSWRSMHASSMQSVRAWCICPTDSLMLREAAWLAIPNWGKRRTTSWREARQSTHHTRRCACVAVLPSAHASCASLTRVGLLGNAGTLVRCFASLPACCSLLRALLADLHQPSLFALFLPPRLVSFAPRLQSREAAAVTMSAIARARLVSERKVRGGIAAACSAPCSVVPLRCHSLHASFPPFSWGLQLGKAIEVGRHSVSSGTRSARLAA